MTEEARWLPDIDALMFPVGEGGACAVHRRAFRTLLGFEPTPKDCLAYFDDFEQAFRLAASTKIGRHHIPSGTNFHLTSRDIARKLVEATQNQHGEQP